MGQRFNINCSREKKWAKFCEIRIKQLFRIVMSTVTSEIMFVRTSGRFWTTWNSIKLKNRNKLFWEHRFYRNSSAYCLRKCGMAVLWVVDWEDYTLLFVVSDILLLPQRRPIILKYCKYGVYTDQPVPVDWV